MNSSVRLFVSTLTAGAAMFAVGRVTAPSGNGASRFGKEGVTVTTSGGTEVTGAAGSPLGTGKTVSEWASLRAKDGKIPAEAMEEAVRRIMTDPNPVVALENFSALLKELTPENATAAWKALQAQAGGAESMRYLPLLSYAWGAIDGPGALKALAEERNRESMTGRFSAIGGWAAQDPAAAMAWLKAHEAERAATAGAEGEPGEGERGGREGMGNRLLKMGLINGLAQSDPAAAMALIGTMDEADRGRLVGLVADKELKRGLDHAAAWAAAITDPAMRRDAMNTVARDYARQDPAKAAAWMTAAGADNVSPDAAGTLAREWTAKEPEKALEWVTSLPDGEARNTAYQDAFRTWSRQDPTASSQYLDQMAAGASKDSAISSFSRGIAREDPAAALQWASTIGDEKARTEAVVRAAQVWNATDGPAAQAWMASSGLAPELQTRILEQPRGREERGFGGGGGGRGGIDFGGRQRRGR